MNVVEHAFVDKLGKTVDKHTLLGKSPICATKIKPRYSHLLSPSHVDGGSNYGVYTVNLSIPLFPKFSPLHLWRGIRSKSSISRKPVYGLPRYTDKKYVVHSSPHIHTVYYGY